MKDSFSGLTKYERFELIDGYIQRFGDLKGCMLPTKYVMEYLEEQYTHSTTVICPCCNESIGRPARRRLSKSLLCFLYELSKFAKPVHYTDVQLIVKSEYGHNITDYTVLEKYNMIEAVASTGKYTITDKGRSFLAGKISVPSWLQIKKDSIVAASNKQVHISQFDVLADLSYNKDEFQRVPVQAHPQSMNKEQSLKYLDELE